MQNPWLIAAVALVALVVWPLQTIVAALLVAALFVVAGAYTMFMMRHPAGTERLRSLDRVAHYTLIGAFGAGVFMIALWPITAAIAALALAVVASVAWVALDYSLHHPALATPRPATEEPEFWAEALLQPTPDPDPTPPPPEPVPSDPTPRVVAVAKRRPVARTRRPGPPAPRTRAPARARRSSRV